MQEQTPDRRATEEQLTKLLGSLLPTSPQVRRRAFARALAVLQPGTQER